jgi:prepilin-type N-terminal cleavage/methylation domain-containing protein
MTPERRARDQASDDGFTLIELLIAMVIAGIIISAIGSAMLIGLRTTFATGAELRQSGNAQLLSQYFVADIQSSDSTGLDRSPGAVTGCSTGVASGTSLLRTEWTDASAGGSDHIAAYRLESGEIHRYACTPGAAADVTTVARDVTSATVAPPTGRRISMVVTVTDPDAAARTGPFTFTVQASYRTPPPGCPPVAGSVVTSPATASLSGSSGRLTTSIAVSFNTSGTCLSTPSVTYQYGDTVAASAAVAATGGSAGTWSATLPATAPGSWTGGQKTLTVTSDSVNRTTTFTVFDPNACALSGSPVVTNGTQLSGTLVSSPTLTVNSSGVCSGGGTLTYQYGSNPAQVDNVTMTQSGSAWTGIVPASAHAGAWTSGIKAFTVSISTAAAVQVPFQVTDAPVCAVTSGPTASPNPVLLKKGYLGSAPSLASSVTVTFGTSSLCIGSTASVTYTYDGTTTTASVAATGTGGGTTWTAAIPATAPAGGTWTTGSKTITALVGGAAPATGTLTVAQGCAINGALTINPSSVTVNASKNISNNVAVSWSTVGACTASDFAVKYQFGDSAAQSNTAPATSAGTASFSATIPKNSDNWTKGNKTVSVLTGAVGDDRTTIGTLVVK